MFNNKDLSKIPQINHDKFSGCFLDHAPVGSSREAFLLLRKSLAKEFGEGDPVDVGDLSDQVISDVRDICVQLRLNNKPI